MTGAGDKAVDVVVVGSGHNALIVAAYAARAGLRVVVVEGYERIGGDTITEDLTLPGFHHDACSSAHNLIQQNPLLRDDELGLARAHGLRYLRPDPVCTVPFPDGEALTMHLEPERTAREFARLSARDARAYLDLLREWDTYAPLYAAERAAPPALPGESEARALGRPGGREYLRLGRMSALDVLAERFQDAHVRAFMAWLATMTLEQIDRPNTGLLAMSLAAGRQRHSWTTPQGGSGALAAALGAVVMRHGGRIETGHWVVGVHMVAGRAAGVVLDDGRTLTAVHAVVSSAPVTRLPALLGEAVGEDFARAMARWRTGLTMFVSHYALAEAPVYRHPLGPVSAVAMGAVTSVENLLDHFHAFRRGRVHDDPLILAVNSSLVDPERAPPGRHTLKVISYYPYALAGAVAWDEVKEAVADRLLAAYARLTTNVRDAIILARRVESPLDLERRNPSNIRGSCHGGSVDPDQAGFFRPAPAWSGYRTPVEGLYLTGAGTHPGGSVSGLPGRNCARVLLADLGLGWPAGPRAAAEGGRA